MTDAETIRAVSRALNLLRAMNGRPSWPLHELYLATGLPKPTLSRLLATLKAEGYVRSEEAAGIYRLTAKVRELGAGYTEQSRLVEVGRPIALQVTKRIKWPLALGLLDGDAIVVRFSSMPYSPLAVHTTTLGHRLGLLETAMGRAYLAFCSEAERRVVLGRLAAANPEEGEGALAWMVGELAQVRTDGYAVRQPSAARGSATLAAPILHDGSAIGVLSMTTFGKAMTREVVAAHAPVVIDTAHAIADAYAADGA